MKNTFLDYLEAASEKKKISSPKLQLNNMKLKDDILLSELSKYKDVVELNLEDNIIKNTVPIEIFKSSLKNLNLANNAVKNIWPLTKLINLKILDLSENPIDLSVGFEDAEYKEHGLYDIFNFFEPLKKLELIIFPKRIKAFEGHTMFINSEADKIGDYFEKRGQKISIEVFP